MVWRTSRLQGIGINSMKSQKNLIACVGSVCTIFVMEAVMSGSVALEIDQELIDIVQSEHNNSFLSTCNF